jgi:predicted RNA binding protein YcfA (HicA-like mRNA interferase family)
VIKSRKDVLRILKDNGYSLVSSKKHEKYSNGKETVIIPQKHKDFHVTGHKIILKRAGLL